MDQMDEIKKKKRGSAWTHTKKGVLRRTLSQTALSTISPQPADGNEGQSTVSQRSVHEYLSINRRVIPHKCSSKACQTFNKTSNVGCQISAYQASKAVQVSVSKSHMSTQCHPSDLSQYKGVSRYIRNEKYWEKFINFLEQHGQLKDFMSLAMGLNTNRIDPNNLAWISALHMGRYSNSTSTTGMRYDASLMEFYQLFYLLFGSCSLNVLRGPTHFGDLVSQTCAKGKYDPSTSRINFPIPSISSIKKMKTRYSKSVPPGLIEATLDMFQDKAKEGKQFVISFDGMKVSRGCKGMYDGDVNLWGIEGPPSVSAALKNLETMLKYTSRLNRKVNETNITIHKLQVEGVLLRLGKKLEKIRKRLTGEYLLERKLENLKAKNPSKVESFEHPLGHIYQHTTQLENCVNRSLNVIVDLCKILAHINGCGSLIADTHFVQLHKQANFFPLLPAEFVSQYLDLEHEDNTIFCSQRSDIWHRLRKKARVTGSTLFKALGFDTLKAEKEHVHVFVKGRPAKDMDEQVQKYIDFGIANEIHAVSTLVGCIMPAYLPSCCIFLECGPAFIHGSERKNLLEVSVDGIIQCKNGDTCTHDHKGRKKIAVEVKCHYPNEDFPKFPTYRLPTRYIPQLLSEMAAHDVQELWLVSYTLYSTTVSVVYFDATLWGKLLDLTELKYGKENVAIPAKLHPDSKQLKFDLVNFVDTHTRYFCEVPSFRGEMIVNLPDEYISPYAAVALPNANVVDFNFIMDTTRIAVEECNLLFKSIHEALRLQSSEIVMFVISDKDRIQSSDSPTTAPLGFALKGSCLSNKQLRHLINTTRNECKSREIPILAECYDGQWQLTVMTTEDGEPLNVLRLAHRTWSKIRKMGKLRILEEVLSTNRISNGDKDLLLLNRVPVGITEYNSMKIKRDDLAALHVESTGGRLIGKPVAGKIVTCRNTELWLNTDDQKEDRRPISKQIGLKPDERNLLSTLPRQIREEVEALDTNDLMNEDTEDTDYLPDLDSPTQLDKLLTNENFNLVRDILDELREYDIQKWGNVQVFELYPDMLKDSEVLYDKCRVGELAKIGKVLESYTHHSFFSNQFTKAKNANIICKAFQGSNFVRENEKKRSRIQHSPKTLHQLSRSVLLQKIYPTICLQVSYATVLHELAKTEWEKRSKIPLSVTVPRGLACKPPDVMKLFCYPEYSSTRKQLEPRILDYSHILTNMRMHICKNGYDFCKTDHYIELCHDRPDILSQSAVLHRLDPMNVYTAMRFFGCPVQEWMESKGYYDTASFIQIVRNWNRACDERGMSADERVEHMYNIHDFLTQGVDFDAFPSISTERYIKGMPIQTFEAILQNVSTRIILYSLAQGFTYNTRSVSTLVSESCNSDIHRLDKEGSDYLKACNMNKLIGKLSLVNDYKHRRSRNFYLAPTLKGTYPVHLNDEDDSALQCEEQNTLSYFKNHFFDYKDVNSRQRKRRSDISMGIAPLRGVPGIRTISKAKIDESKILPHTREGLGPRISYRDRLKKQTEELSNIEGFKNTSKSTD